MVFRTTSTSKRRALSEIAPLKLGAGLSRGHKVNSPHIERSGSAWRYLKTEDWKKQKFACKRRLRRSEGLTLAELMISTAIASILGLGTAALVFYSTRSFAAMANYVDLDHRSRIALDSMSREIRQANRLIDHSATSLTFEDYDGTELEYVYDSSAQTLTRWKDDVSDTEPLLTECISLEFAIFQRNSIGGTYDQYPTATSDTCKLVQLKWTCSRKILGIDKNTESVQSAKIVIRKQ